MSKNYLIISEIKINFRTLVGISDSPIWPDWSNINNAITTRDDLLKLWNVSYFGMENWYVISEV